MGEMSKIEEVARALAERHYKERFGVDKLNAHILMNVEANMGTFRKEAKAAIEALRNANLIYAVLEPRTEADEIAGRREFYGDSGAWLSLWNSAIDAALKE